MEATMILTGKGNMLDCCVEENSDAMKAKERQGALASSNIPVGQQAMLELSFAINAPWCNSDQMLLAL